ncbi:unnamed protein product [Discosporangium mesarthrocarpum]
MSTQQDPTNYPSGVGVSLLLCSACEWFAMALAPLSSSPVTTARPLVGRSYLALTRDNMSRGEARRSHGRAGPRMMVDDREEDIKAKIAKLRGATSKGETYEKVMGKGKTITEKMEKSKEALGEEEKAAEVRGERNAEIGRRPCNAGTSSVSPFSWYQLLSRCIKLAAGPRSPDSD